MPLSSSELVLVGAFVPRCPPKSYHNFSSKLKYRWPAARPQPFIIYKNKQILTPAATQIRADNQNDAYLPQIVRDAEVLLPRRGAESETIFRRPGTPKFRSSGPDSRAAGAGVYQ